jgi:hypothetical protein
MTRQRRGSVAFSALLGAVLVAVMVGQLTFAFPRLLESVRRVRLQTAGDRAERCPAALPGTSPWGAAAR